MKIDGVAVSSLDKKCAGIPTSDAVSICDKAAAKLISGEAEIPL